MFESITGLRKINETCRGCDYSLDQKNYTRLPSQWIEVGKTLIIYKKNKMETEEWIVHRASVTEKKNQ